LGLSRLAPRERAFGSRPVLHGGALGALLVPFLLVRPKASVEVFLHDHDF
jgi:hypothetical protein